MGSNPRWNANFTNEAKATFKQEDQMDKAIAKPNENKGLMTREQLIAQSRADAGAQAQQISVSDKQMVYLCQGTTTEVKKGKAKCGEFILRTQEHNFGESFTAIVVGLDCFYTKWEGERGNAHIVWSILEEMLPHAPRHIQAECQWTGPDGKIPPTANRTWQFALIHVKDGKLDPNGFGVFYAALAVTAEKQGKEIAKIIKRQATREDTPSYRLVMRFTSFDEVSAIKDEYKNWEASLVTVLDIDKHYEIVAVGAKEAQIYQSARAASLAKFNSMLPTMARGKQEALALDAVVDREAQEEMERMADREAAREASQQSKPDNDPPF